MTISRLLLPELEHEMANTRRILENIPEDKLAWKPHTKSMTMGRLAGHVAELASWGTHTLKLETLDISPKADGTYEAHVMTSRADTLAKFDAWVAEAKEALRETSDEDFQKNWSLTGSGQTYLSMPRIDVMRGMVLNHMVHHRGQLTVYLRLNDVRVPGMYGPTADDARTF
jgi:uncharacterized damage-inducible protein DinB